MATERILRQRLGATMVENKILNVGRAPLEIEARTRASYPACGLLLAISGM